MSAQAVGGAVGHNPVSIIVPCHRVVGADGSLTGYAGGIERKIVLLCLEGADTARFHPEEGNRALKTHRSGGTAPTFSRESGDILQTCAPGAYREIFLRRAD